MKRLFKITLAATALASTAFLTSCATQATTGTEAESAQTGSEPPAAQSNDPIIKTAEAISTVFNGTKALGDLIIPGGPNEAASDGSQ